MFNVDVIVGLQYGSEGKGSLAGYLAYQRRPDTVVCNFSPNAGHTFRDYKRWGPTPWVTSMLPIGSISPGVKRVLIGPGAVIDPEILLREITSMIRIHTSEGRDPPLVIVHPNAAVVTQRHRDAERRLVTIGSTMKGTSEAMIAKMRRGIDAFSREIAAYSHELAGCEESHRLRVSRSAYQDSWFFARNVQVEGCQGYSLSIHSEFWPYCTSRDTTPMQTLADVALPMGLVGRMNTWGCMRTYPIRVANRYDADGNQVGTSGGTYPAQEELQWSDLGREPELTTVTKLPRRVFAYSVDQVKEAITAGGVDNIYVSFLDYIPGADRVHWLKIANQQLGGTVNLASVGPDVTDMIRVSDLSFMGSDWKNLHREGQDRQ